MTTNPCFNIERQSKDKLLQLLRASSFAARINVEAVERCLDEAESHEFSFYLFEDPELAYFIILSKDAPNA